jgi:hypothetical protein
MAEGLWGLLWRRRKIILTLSSSVQPEDRLLEEKQMKTNWKRRQLSKASGRKIQRGNVDSTWEKLIGDLSSTKSLSSCIHPFRVLQRKT